MTDVSRLECTGSYRARGRGADFAYAIADSAFGRMLVAGTNRGVSFVCYGLPDRRLEAELRGDFPEASFHRDDAAMRDWTMALVRFVGGKSAMPSVPLDIRGTPFQLRVWNELCAIPIGATRTYGEIARRIGRPTATRAVGAAVGANPVSILIPCHRAVAFDGSLHNYRWGLESKRKLLEIEAKLR